MRLSLLLTIAVELALTLCAHASTCTNLVVEDRMMPSYAPIARAAHVQGAVRFEVHVDGAGTSEIKLLEGPRLLSGAAEDYISARRHLWATGGEHEACSYIATVEYRLISSDSDSANDFHRVTVLGPEYALVEAQNVKPTCSDCASDECPSDEAIESGSLVYPPMARAAHVSGEVSARIAFDQHGKAISVDQFIGSEMLRATTEAYLKSWHRQPLPSYMESCHSNILIEYRLTAATEQVQGDTKIYKADATHILVEDHPALIIDPDATITKIKKHFLFF